MRMKIALRAIAVLTIMSLTACATNKQVQIKVVEIPELPIDCREHARSGVESGDRLDVALIKTDNALSEQVNRTDRCAEWYDEIRQGQMREGDENGNIN